MRDLKKQSLVPVYAEELLLHRIATTPAYRCCDSRAWLDARAPVEPRERCLRNEAGARCMAPPRSRGRRRVSA